MQKQQKVLTEEQAARMTEDAHKSMELAKQQLGEYKEKLIEELNDLDAMVFGLSPAQHTQLIEQADMVKFEMVRIEPSMKEGEKQTVSVVYTYEDELHAFLHRVDFKSKFNLATNDKGISLDEEKPPTKA